MDINLPIGSTSNVNGFTPQINTVGVFTLLAPFKIDGSSYRTSSVTTLESEVATGRDVLNDIYISNNLTMAEYLADLSNNVNLITLTNATNGTTTPIQVPSSYISGVPIEHPVPYSRFIITADLGELPSGHSVELLLSEIKNITNAHLGVETSVELNKVLLDRIVSQEESDAITAVRKLAVDNFTSTYTSLKEAKKSLVLANTKIANLESIIAAQDAELAE